MNSVWFSSLTSPFHLCLSLSPPLPQIHSDLHHGLGTSQHQSSVWPFLSLSSLFHRRLALSGSLLQYLSPSWPVLQNPHHPHQTPSLSPFRANVVVRQIQVCQGRVVLQPLCQCLTADKDLQNTWWNHLKIVEIHMQEISTPSTAFFSYFRSYSHILLSQVKLKEQSQNHSDLHDWLGTSQHQCSVVFLSLSSLFHRGLALSGSLLQYLSPSWPVLQNPHHPHQTPSLSPFRANVVVRQIQVCQGRVVLQPLCQCLTADKDLQNTWWNHLKIVEIHMQEISTPSTAFFSYFRSYSHILLSQVKLKEQSQNHSDLHDWLGTSQHQCSVVFLSLISPFHLPLALSGSILPHLSPSWLVPQKPHHPHQTPSLSPYRANVVQTQIHDCQGRVVLQSFCQCLTADKDLQMRGEIT